jgi:hypothetical protein
MALPRVAPSSRTDLLVLDYEGVDQANGITTSAIVPTDTARTGLLHLSNCNGNAASCQVAVDPNVAPALALFPHINSTTLNPDSGYYVSIVDKIGTEQYFFGKLDHRFSGRDSVHGNYFYDTGTSSAPDSLNDVVSASKSIRQGLGIEYTIIITPSIVNVARVGATRSVQPSGTIQQVVNKAVTDPILAQIPGKDSGSISIGGFASLPTGPLSTDYNFENFTTFQEYENVTSHTASTPSRWVRP